MSELYLKIPPGFVSCIAELGPPQNTIVMRRIAILAVCGFHDAPGGLVQASQTKVKNADRLWILRITPSLRVLVAQKTFPEVSVLVPYAYKTAYETRGLNAPPEIAVDLIFRTGLEGILKALGAFGEYSPINTHPNISILLRRMERSYSDEDYSGVLHAGACIFEVLAKIEVGDPLLNKKSLGSFVQKFINGSRLPLMVNSYMWEVYKRRNTESMAGHGSLDPSSITQAEALEISSFVKAIVQLHARLGVR